MVYNSGSIVFKVLVRLINEGNIDYGCLQLWYCDIYDVIGYVNAILRTHDCVE